MLISTCRTSPLPPLALRSALSLLLTLSLTPSPLRHRLRAETAVAAEPRADTPAQGVATQALAQLVAHNDAFVRQHAPRDFSAFAVAQHPRVTVVACADSRFHMGDISGNPDGDVFVVRNIGNQIDSSQGSVEYAMRHLHTPLLLILGHVGCGAIHAAMSDYSGESPALRRELDGLHLALRRTPAQGSIEARWRQHILANIHQQVRYAVTEYTDEIRRGQAVVVGAIYDFRGELGGGHGRLHILNINGESDRARLRQTVLWQALRAKLEALSVSPQALPQ